MISKKRFILIGLTSLLAMGAPGCGDSKGGDPADAVDSVEDVPAEGRSTLTISGEIEREREGTATFILHNRDSLGVWILRMEDASPWTFSLILTDVLRPDEFTRPREMALPEPGTYPITQDILEESGAFNANYQHVGDFEQPHQYFYQTNQEFGGTLTIETSSEEFVSGSFEFQAVRRNEDRWAEEPGGEVTISGSFQARPHKTESDAQSDAGEDAQTP